MPSGSVGIIENSLGKWRCETRINFELVAESSISEINQAGEISWGPLEDGLVANSVITTDFFFCITDSSTSDANAIPIAGLGIIYNSNVNFIVDGVSPLAANQFDLESVTMHEIGHNALLGHIQDETKIMHGSVRDIDKILSSEDIAGGQHSSVLSSTDLLCVNRNIAFSGMEEYNIEECTNSTYTSIQNSKISIYPNPTDGFISIKFEDISSYQVQVLDILGRVVYEDLVNSQSEVVLNRKFDAGVYTVLLTSSGGKLISSKFVSR